jgi:hypothetical protein
MLVLFGLLLEVTHLHMDLFLQLETGFCIRVHMERRILARRTFIVHTCSYPITVVFLDVDVAFAMPRCVLPYRVPACRLVCLVLNLRRYAVRMYPTLCMDLYVLIDYCYVSVTVLNCGRVTSCLSLNARNCFY